MTKKIRLEHIILACMFGVTLTGCGSSNDDSTTIQSSSEATVEQAGSAYIQSANGSALSGVTITIAGQTFTTDSNGVAKFKVAVPKSETSVVVHFSKDGFISQSLSVNVKELSQITANLLMVKQSISVANIEKAQVIESTFNKAKIVIPNNAFVLPNGQAAEGPVTVEFSPWDIQTNDLNAMPANGIAMTANGQWTNLISAGMITATFKNAKGEHLQLASGKTADIQMDLPVDSINNTKLVVGSKIPLWHFDESKGVWVPEGEGDVISSSTSPVGLAVHATVSHFSTWNWDFTFNNSNTVEVKCLSENVATPCSVTALVQLADGSKITKVNTVAAEGTSIINLPENGTITWTAKDMTGTLIGEATSGMSGQVTINLTQPTTSNFVKCLTADQKPTACSGTVNGFAFNVPEEGGKIITGLKNVTSLTWNAVGTIYEKDSAVYRSEGTKNSSLTEDVTIVLDQTKKLYDAMPFNLTCLSEVQNVANCNVKLSINYSLLENEERVIESKNYVLPLNQAITVYLPIPPRDLVQGAWVSGAASIQQGTLLKFDNHGNDEIYSNNALIFDVDQSPWCDSTLASDTEIDVDNPPTFLPCPSF